MSMLPRIGLNAWKAGSFFCATAALLAFGAEEAKAQLPAVVAYGARIAYPTITNPTKVTRDAAGDIFVVSGGNIYEIPASGPLQVVVPSTDPGVASINYITADSAGDLYVARSGDVVTEITRNANGTYNLGAASEITVTMTNLLQAADGYYYTNNDIAVDSLNNVYEIVNTNPPSGSTTHGGGIYMSGPSAPNGQFLLGSFAAQPTVLPTSLTVDAAGDIFYADTTNVYEITAASVKSAVSSATPVTAGTIIGSGMTTPKFIYLDPAGNVYVGNNTSADYVIVNSATGFSSSSATYTLPSTITGHSGYTYGAVDNQGNLILDYGGSLEFYGASKLYVGSTATYATTTAAGGAGSSTTPASGPSMALLFTAATTLSSTAPIVDVAYGSFYGGAGTGSNAFNTASNTTCAAGTTYTAGQTCAIEVGYKAYVPGVFSSGVNIYGGATSAASNLLASFVPFGVATGPAVAIDTGSKAAVGTGYAVPTGIAVDNTGSMYVADSTNNTVYKFAAGSTAASAATASYGTGLNAPSGVAIDEGGNLFIADSGNNRVVYLPNNSGTLGTQATLSTGSYSLNSPRGLGIDGQGNVYVADTGNARVLIVPNPTAGEVGTTYTVGSGFTAPYGIAVDKLNNVYVADKGANAVYEVPGGYGLTSSGTANVGSGVVTTVGTGFSGPTGVAVDASGTVYVADGGNSKVWKVSYTGGAFAAPVTLFSATASGIAKPFGIAIDLTSDLYFTDSNLPGVYFVQRSAASAGTAATLAFGSVAAGATNTLSATLNNSGYTTALTGSLSTSPASPYSLNNNGCSTALTSGLAAGANCAVSVIFTGPASPLDTNQAGSMIFSSNELNAATSPTTKVTFSGQSTGAVSAVTISGAAATSYGMPETYTVTATDSGGSPASVSGSYSVSITGGAGSSSASVTLNGGVGSFLLPSVGASASPYALSVSVSGVASNSLNVTVAKGSLTVTANNYSRVFDAANPVFGYTYSGFANGDTSSVVSGTPAVTTTAVRTSPAGTYALTLGGTLTATNYVITKVNGTLTVTGSAPQTIMFDALPGFTGGSTVTLVGISTSGLPLTYTTNAGSISGNVLTVPATGATVTITASQTGNASYAAATSVTRSFTAQ